MFITSYKIGEVYFRLLGTIGFHDMKDLLLRARLVVTTFSMKMSRRCLADYVEKLQQRACPTCSKSLICGVVVAVAAVVSSTPYY